MAVNLTDEIKREIGQHFVFGFHGHDLSEEIKVLIKDYHLGNVILMKRNIRDVKQVRRIIRDLQHLAKEAGHKKPLLIGIDQENGNPGAMALAAIGSVELAQEVSAACGNELKMVGINWVYSPVADVNLDSRNPVIGVRSFGDDPKEVARYASAVSHGLTSAGIAPSAKHFPGHGDTHTDSHLALPRILKSKCELEQSELVPFKALAGSDGVASIMIGHMALPLLTGDDTPASLSKAVTKELLREEMGYTGVVVTDCLEMDAIADRDQGGCGVEEGSVRSLLSGVDVVMACHTFDSQVGAVKEVYAAVEAGRLDFKELQESGTRVGKMKDLFVGGWEDVLNYKTDEVFEEHWNRMKAENLSLSMKAYRKSCTVVWGSALLPLKVNQERHILLFTPEMESLNRAVDDAEGMLRDRSGRLRNTAGGSYLALASLVQERSSSKHVVYSSRDDRTQKISGDVGAVMFVLRNADRSVWQREYLKKALVQCVGIPVIILSSCGPYDLEGIGGEVQTGTVYVASFEFTREAFEAFVGVVFDGYHDEGRARLPVAISGY